MGFYFDRGSFAFVGHRASLPKHAGNIFRGLCWLAFSTSVDITQHNSLQLDLAWRQCIPPGSFCVRVRRVTSAVFLLLPRPAWLAFAHVSSAHRSGLLVCDCASLPKHPVSVLTLFSVRTFRATVDVTQPQNTVSLHNNETNKISTSRSRIVIVVSKIRSLYSCFCLWFLYWCDAKS